MSDPSHILIWFDDPSRNKQEIEFVTGINLFNLRPVCLLTCSDERLKKGLRVLKRIVANGTLVRVITNLKRPDLGDGPISTEAWIKHILQVAPGIPILVYTTEDAFYEIKRSRMLCHLPSNVYVTHSKTVCMRFGTLRSLDHVSSDRHFLRGSERSCAVFEERFETWNPSS